MKKIITLLIAIMCLAACGTKEVENKEDTNPIKIVSPSGAPALALLDLVNEQAYTLDIVDGSDVLGAEFTTGESDVIIAPINLGVKLSKETQNYELTSVITWGNLHLVSTNKDFKQGNVAAFGEASVPGKIINSLELNEYNFEWFNAVNEASAALLSGQYEAAVLAEPYLTMTKSKAESEIYEIADVQDLYKENTGYDTYPQAAIFVNNKKDVDYNDVLEKIKASIETYNNDSEALGAKIEEVDMEALGFANKDLIKKAYSKMALNYVPISQCQDEVDQFLKLFNIER